MAPEVNWDEVETRGDFTPIPEGTYRVSVIEINEDTTGKGDEMWKTRLEVQDGPHKGRLIFDNIVFSVNAIKRAKLIFSRLGVKTEGKMNLTPDMILDKECFVDVVIDDYTDDDGNTKKKNSVLFAGYHSLTEGGSTPQASGSQQKLSGGKKVTESPKKDPNDELPF